MTIVEAMRQAVSRYVERNGIGNVVTKKELSAVVNEIMTVESNSFLPADYCYNRTNQGINFEKQVHLFELMDDGNYKVLGEDYPYSGPVFGRKEDGTGYEIKGVWLDGEYEEGLTDIYLRLIDLHDSLTHTLKKSNVQIKDTSVIVSANGRDLCSALVMDEVYKISTGITAWKEKTSYFCSEDDGIVVYYVETIDECIGEIKRLVDFSSMNGRSNHTSELSQIVSAKVFENAYAHFIEQADRNVETRKAQGSKVPYGFKEKPECDGAHFKAQYGQGIPSAAPYMNWWVVSIYYLSDSGKIIMGIEEDRYPHLKEMKIEPLRYEQIGNKKVNAAVFYSAHKTYVDYGELYEKFIQVCEEVIRLGLE